MIRLSQVPQVTTSSPLLTPLIQGTGKAFGTHKNLKFVAAEGHNPQMFDEEGQLKRREEHTRIAAAAAAAAHKQGGREETRHAYSRATWRILNATFAVVGFQVALLLP